MIVDPPASPSEDEHPLDHDPSSDWNTFFKDNELLIVIERDVLRLLPDISLFQMKVKREHAKSKLVLSERIAHRHLIARDAMQESPSHASKKIADLFDTEPEDDPIDRYYTSKAATAQNSTGSAPLQAMLSAASLREEHDTTLEAHWQIVEVCFHCTFLVLYQTRSCSFLVAHLVCVCQT